MPVEVMKMLVIGGEATGVKLIELVGWVGRVLIIPRLNLKDIKDREEANWPAIYFLFGENEDGDPLVYIGESETFYSRLSSHDANKDFWERAVVFTGGLDRAGVKYLEHVSTKEAKNADRYNVINIVEPQENHLSEIDKYSIGQYFEKIKFVLSSFGFVLFDSIEKSIGDKRLYYLKADGTEAKAQLLDDGSLNVLKGSKARKRETAAFWGWSLAARRKFLEDGTFIDSGDGVSYTYTKNVLFKSPSAAAATTTGRPINGWTAWKDEQGKTLDENVRK